MILMRIGFGADHGGCALKDELIKHVQSKGVQVTDFGTNDPSVSVDYLNMPSWWAPPLPIGMSILASFVVARE